MNHLVLTDFRRAFAAAEPRQPGEYDTPSPEAVERVRANLEAMRQRLRDATPVRQFSTDTRGGL